MTVAAVAERIKMALLEAGYPDADAHVFPGGLCIYDAPPDAVDKAFALVARITTPDEHVGKAGTE